MPTKTRSRRTTTRKFNTKRTTRFNRFGKKFGAKRTTKRTSRPGWKWNAKTRRWVKATKTTRTFTTFAKARKTRKTRKTIAKKFNTATARKFKFNRSFTTRSTWRTGRRAA